MDVSVRKGNRPFEATGGDMSEAVLKLADEGAIAACLEAMERVQQQIWFLHDYAAREVANQDGFRGVFALLCPALDDLASSTHAVAERFSTNYGAVIESLAAAALSLRACDGLVDAEFATVVGRLGSVR
jgi:hypothetical protein